VYRIRDPLPLAYLVGRLHVATGDKDAFNRLIDPSFVPGAEAVVSELPPGWRDTGDVAAADGTVTFRSYEGERVVLDVRTARQMLLVLSDADYPGWEANVDGAPRPIVRTNVLVRGVVVPPGDHTVEFRYDPRSFRLGMWISLVTLVVLAGALALIPLPPKSWPRARI
jgi:hypothetical protein